MTGPLPHAVRTSAAVVSIAAGLLALGCTAQSTDGYVHAAFTGPLGLFGPDAIHSGDTDVIAIGGLGDASSLAALLKSTAPRTNAVQSLRAPLQSGAIPNSAQANGFTGATTSVTGAPVAAAPPAPANAPAIDDQGRVDCTGAVSCQLDPKTNVTTVTYSDGTMAIVQRINGMTLVTFKTVPENVPDSVIGKTQNQSKTPVPYVPAPLAVAAAPAKPAPSPLASVPVPTTPDTTPDSPPLDSAALDSVPAVNPGPAAATPATPNPGITASTARPRVTVTKPPQDYSPSRPSGPAAANTSQPGVSRAIDAVKEAVSSVVDAVGKAVNPGASTGVKRSNTN